MLLLAVVFGSNILRTKPVETGASTDEAARTALRMRSVQALQAVNLAEQARGMLFPVFDIKRQELALEMFQHSIELDPGLHHGYAGVTKSSG